MADSFQQHAILRFSFHEGGTGISPGEQGGAGIQQQPTFAFFGGMAVAFQTMLFENGIGFLENPGGRFRRSRMDTGGTQKQT